MRFISGITMPNRNPFIRVAWAAALLFALLPLMYWCMGKFQPMISEVPWHVEGRVLDNSTNAISGVKVRVEALGKVSVPYNFIFEQRRSHFETTTDETGRFVSDFRASFFEMDFIKTGYREKKMRFGVYGDTNTNRNQNLQIFLDSEPN